MKTVQSHVSDRGVQTLSMNRPAQHNAFDKTMIRELTAALQAADRDSAVRVVVITGSGASFSAGADVHWMRSLVNASQHDNECDALELATLLRTLNYLSKPVIARINGAAYGGGVGLIAACDIAIAADTASFGLTEVRLGLVPAVISHYVFRCIGEGNARRYFLSGEHFDSHQALAIGLIHQVVEPAQLDPVVATSARQLLKGGPLAVSSSKQLLFTVAGHSAEQQQKLDEYTARLIAGLRVSAEGQEGLAAFLKKRKPAWLDT